MKTLPLFEKLHVRVPLFLAPMAGVTDMPFRKLCRTLGAEVTYSEFVSSEGIIRKNKKTLRFMSYEEDEHPFGIQLFGYQPHVMAEAAKFIQETINPDLIDLNFGCPVSKVVKNGAGSVLLKDLPLLRDIATAVCSAVTIPVTAKIRAGWDETHLVIPEIAPLLEESGIQLITLHPRTASMRYKGKADWTLIRRLKENTSLPVIGNGDIRSADDALSMIEQTACDGVMVGRGALGNPWLFHTIRSALTTGKIPKNPSDYEKISLMKKHFNEVVSFYGKDHAYKLFKKHFSWYTVGLPHGAHFRQKAMMSTSTGEMENIIDSYRTFLEKHEVCQ